MVHNVKTTKIEEIKTRWWVKLVGTKKQPL